MNRAKFAIQLATLAILVSVVMHEDGHGWATQPAPHGKRASVPEPFRFAIGGQTGSTSAFIRIALPRGVTADFPRAWRVLGPDELQLIDTTAGAMQDLSGVPMLSGDERVLVASNSMPRSTYAAIRITSETPPSAKPSELTQFLRIVGASSNDNVELRALGTEMRKELSQVLAIGGIPLLKFYGMRVDRFGAHPVLVTEYSRMGPKGPVLVQINQVLTSNQDVKINLSYRQSEGMLWKPVLARIRGSIRIR